MEVTDRLLRILGLGWDMVEWVTDRKGHDYRYSLDDSKLRRLGYRPGVAFDQGLAETVRWYAGHAAWWEPQSSGGPSVPSPADPCSATSPTSREAR